MIKVKADGLYHNKDNKTQITKVSYETIFKSLTQRFIPSVAEFKAV